MQNGEIVKQAVNRLAEFQSDQSLVTQANSTPLPGPLRNAFAAVPEITVDKYKVRPFVDRDFEYLQELNHPLHKHMQAGEGLGDMIRGQPAWELCYMFTHPFKDVKAVVKSGGVKALQQAAADEFDEFGLAPMIELIKAVMRQLEIYWEPVLAYKTVDSADDSKKNTLVDGTDSQPTVLDSPLKNVAS